MTMIHTQGLGRHYGGSWAVRNLDLAVAEGELYGFLGPNGAGKTSTIRLLNGLLRPSEGSLTIDGLHFGAQTRQIQAITGLVPDSPPLFDYLTARQYIALVAGLYRVPRKDRNTRSDRLLSVLDLDDHADQICKGYSHGMKKKTHLAAVLTTEPRVLFLDEPTTGLDPKSARTLKNLLTEYRDRGTTIMLSTHVLTTAEEICDRIGILDAGALRAEGTMAELREQGEHASLEDIFLRLTDPQGAPSS